VEEARRPLLLLLLLLCVCLHALLPPAAAAAAPPVAGWRVWCVGGREACEWEGSLCDQGVSVAAGVGGGHRLIAVTYGRE